MELFYVVISWRKFDEQRKKHQSYLQFFVFLETDKSILWVVYSKWKCCRLSLRFIVPFAKKKHGVNLNWNICRRCSPMRFSRDNKDIFKSWSYFEVSLSSLCDNAPLSFFPVERNICAFFAIWFSFLGTGNVHLCAGKDAAKLLFDGSHMWFLLNVLKLNNQTWIDERSFFQLWSSKNSSTKTQTYLWLYCLQDSVVTSNPNEYEGRVPNWKDGNSIFHLK